MNKIQLLENTPNMNALINAGVISTSLPRNIDIYYHYKNTKNVQKTADDHNVSRRHVYNIIYDMEQNV